jgi:NADH pyrophosphatase NudC (nudix superfamily)
MGLQIREVSCFCGHTYETDRTVPWCPKCGQKIFDSEKERQSHKMNKVYIYAVIGMVVATLAYFIFEMLFKPVLAM